MTPIEQTYLFAAIVWCLFGWLFDRPPPDD
jgi:hypothetical protein